MVTTRKRRSAKKTGSKLPAKVVALEKAVAKMSLVPKPKKKSKPFSKAGAIAGRAIGNFWGMGQMGSGIGKWLGSGIGTIFGSGDYTTMGPMPKYNVFTNGSQIPQFSTLRQTNVVCHREYLGDIFGTAGFSNVSYPLNPGIAQTFPWLSSIAANYQEYRFHGLVFEFRSLITDFVLAGAPGVVIMSTNYNADAPLYLTKQQMENAEYAVSVKPTVDMIHGVECANNQTILPERFIRTGVVPVNQDLRLYDLGNFQFATQANPVQDLGELWVSYCIEFFKPIMPVLEADAGPAFHAARTITSSLAPFGSVGLYTNGSLNVLVTGTSVTIIGAQPGVNYFIDVIWNIGSVVTVAYGFLTLSNASITPGGQLFFDNSSLSSVTIPTTTTVTTNGNFQVVITSTLSVQGNIGFSLGTGTYPTGPVDIYVITLDPTVTH